jgi:hypothetical protein
MSPNELRMSGDGLKRPLCPACGAKMRLARREPHPDHGAQFELQTFECPVCGETHTMTVTP